MNETNLNIDLLWFLSITDIKITGGVERLGWVVERRIDTKTDTIKLKLLLDVDATDPFLVEIGVIQDDPDSTDEIIDDPAETNEIIDGDGKI